MRGVRVLNKLCQIATTELGQPQAAKHIERVTKHRHSPVAFAAFPSCLAQLAQAEAEGET